MEFPEQSSNHVECRGEPLHPILWQGEQWAVTEYGIERRDGRYAIEASWFFRCPRPPGLDHAEAWTKHMSGKSRVDIEDFCDCVEAFLLLFNKKGQRTNVASPIVFSEQEIEEYALQAGELAYREAKRKMLRGEKP